MRRVLLCVVALIAGAAVLGTPPVAAQDVVWQPPVDAEVADPFRAPETAYGPGNRGLEYDLPPDSIVHAVDAGRVVFAGSVAGVRHVVVLHGNGLKSTYANVTEIGVSRGQSVAAGDAIGTAGPGFHLTARLGGLYIDPALLLAGAELDVALVADDRPLVAPHQPLAGVGPRRGRFDPVLALAESGTSLLLVPQLVNVATAVDTWHHQECTPIGAPPPARGGREPGDRVLIQVGGLGSTAEGASIAKLDTAQLGYHPDDVAGFSYVGGCIPTPFGLQAPGPESLTAAIGTHRYEAVDTLGDIEVSAARLADKVDRVRELRPSASIDIAAHSLGGVVTRRAVEVLAERHGPAHPVELVVTIGSPHGGADLATVASAGTGALAVVDGLSAEAGEFREAEAVIQLSEVGPDRITPPTAVPEGVTVLAVAGSSDLIVPARKAIWPGATNVLVTTDLPDAVAAHSDLPGRADVLDAVLLAQAGASPRCLGLGELISGAVAGHAIESAEDLATLATGIARWIG